MKNRVFRLRLNRIRETLGVGLSFGLGIICAASQPQHSRTLIPLLKKGAKVVSFELVGLGDTVMSIATYRALLRYYPNTSLTIIATPPNAAILKLANINCEIRIWDIKFESFVAKKVSIVTKNVVRLIIDLLKNGLKMREGKFDIALVPHHDVRISLAALLSWAPNRVGHPNYFWPGDSRRYQWRGLITHPVPAPQKTHYSVSRKVLFEYLGVQVNPADVTITVSDELKTTAKKKLLNAGWKGERIMVIHPGARRRIRMWPSYNFAQLADWAVKQKMFVCVVVGPGEREIGEKIRESMESNCSVFCTSLEEAIALISCADVCVCNDSAAMHLANAVSTPVAAIFSTGPPELTAPCAHAPFKPISPPVMCPHRPCHGLECSLNKPCVELVKVEDVQSAVIKLIKNSRRTQI